MQTDPKPFDASGQGRGPDDGWAAAAAVFCTIIILIAIVVLLLVDAAFGERVAWFAGGVMFSIACVAILGGKR